MCIYIQTIPSIELAGLPAFDFRTVHPLVAILRLSVFSHWATNTEIERECEEEFPSIVALEKHLGRGLYWNTRPSSQLSLLPMWMRRSISLLVDKPFPQNLFPHFVIPCDFHNVFILVGTILIIIFPRPQPISDRAKESVRLYWNTVSDCGPD